MTYAAEREVGGTFKDKEGRKEKEIEESKTPLGKLAEIRRDDGNKDYVHVKLMEKKKC